MVSCFNIQSSFRHPAPQTLLPKAFRKNSLKEYGSVDAKDAQDLLMDVLPVLN